MQADLRASQKKRLRRDDRKGKRTNPLHRKRRKELLRLEDQLSDPQGGIFQNGIARLVEDHRAPFRGGSLFLMEEISLPAGEKKCLLRKDRILLQVVSLED